MIDVLSNTIDGEFSTRPASHEMKRQAPNNPGQEYVQIRDADRIPLALPTEHLLHGFMNQISGPLSFW